MDFFLQNFLKIFSTRNLGRVHHNLEDEIKKKNLKNASKKSIRNCVVLWLYYRTSDETIFFYIYLYTYVIIEYIYKKIQIINEKLQGMQA